MTRQITDEACHAFRIGKNFKKSNMTIESHEGGTYMYLWGNLIAKRCGGITKVSLAGYNTNTTKERLRGLGANIQTKKGIAYINEIPMNPYEFYEIN